ncbi:hypothetical protein [Bradyrhizobium sp.]|uniref:hypothetical protein n=1 Tax=Bradyrhizobium sp. TaxID=376 RepID=UPI003C496EDC
MTKLGILSAGFIAAATFITPALAQGVTQEPGAFGFYYPDSHYLTGSYGVRATPRPGYYYRHAYPGAVYGGYYGPGPAVGWAPGVVLAPADSYAYYGGPAPGVEWYGQ